MNKIEIELGISGDEQQASFGNATLQGHGDLEFSIAMHVTVPDTIKTEADLGRYLRWMLGTMTDSVGPGLGFRAPVIHFEVQIGPEGRGEDDNEEDD